MTLIDKAEALAERAMTRASERYNGCKPHFSVKDADLMAMLAATLRAALASTDAAQAREAEVYYKLRWIAGARPPVHPEPMNGSHTFSTEEKARAFFRSLASDAKFVSLERIEVTRTALIGEARP